MESVSKIRQFQRWTKEEVNFVKENHKKMTIKELSEKLNRTPVAISSMLYDYNLTPHSKIKRYSNEEIEFINKNHNKISVIQIGKALGRTSSSVRLRMLKMGYRGICELICWDENKLTFLKENKHLSYKELSEKTGASRRMIESKMRELGLNKFRNKPNSKEIICISCSKKYTANSDNFYLSRTGKINSNRCIPCCKENHRIVSSKSIDNYIKRLLIGIKTDEKRRNKNNYEANIDLEYIKGIYLKQRGRCAITNDVLEHKLEGGKSMRNLSIDRVDSKVGYIKGNIQLVCTWANISKTSLSMSDYKLYILKAYNNLILKLNEVNGN